MVSLNASKFSNYMTQLKIKIRDSFATGAEHCSHSFSKLVSFRMECS